MKLTDSIRQVVTALPLRAYVKDTDHRYLFVNDTFAADHGVQGVDLVGKTEKDVFGEEFAAKTLEEEKRIWETRRPIDTVETIVLNERECSFSIRKSLLADAEGNPVALLGIMRDDTKLVELKKEVQKGKDHHENMLYVISHDLQEPLRMVVGFSELLAQRYSGALDEKAEQYLGYAVDGAKRMQQMIGDLLAYGRVVSRGDPFEPIDSNEVLASVLSELKPKIEDEDADIQVAGLPRVKADRKQLYTVFRNLILNALIFRKEESPCIEISGRIAGSHAEITVADNGMGIDPKHHNRIFVIFQRLHSRDEYPGRGSGLAMAKRIVERHGGSINVASVPGEGARFTFTLPVSNHSRNAEHDEEH